MQTSNRTRPPPPLIGCLSARTGGGASQANVSWFKEIVDLAHAGHVEVSQAVHWSDTACVVLDQSLAAWHVGVSVTQQCDQCGGENSCLPMAFVHLRRQASGAWQGDKPVHQTTILSHDDPGPP